MIVGEAKAWVRIWMAAYSGLVRYLLGDLSEGRFGVS